MADPSSECLQRLIEIERELGALAVHIHGLGPVTPSSRMGLGMTARLQLVGDLKASSEKAAEDCSELFGDLEPLLGLVTLSVMRDDPVTLIRDHVVRAHGRVRALLS